MACRANIVQANLAIAPSAPQTLFAAVRTATGIEALPLRRWRRELDDGDGRCAPRQPASAAAICRSCGSIRRIPTSSTPPASSVGNRSMAARPGPPGAARPAATIIKTSGSIRTTPSRSCSRAIRARSSPSTAARPGVPGITNRPRSSITSARTTRSRIASTAASRKAARSASPAAGTTARSRSAIGIRSRAEEYGYVVADPLDPDIVYGGKLSRYDRRTGQAQNILAARAAFAGFPNGAHAAGRLFAASIRICFSSPATRSGKRAIAATTGRRSVRT